MDAREQRRKRDRERYAQMSNEEKQQKLKKRREDYQQKENKKYADKNPQQRTHICAQKRQKYAKLQPEQKKARIEQVEANRELRRTTPSKDSNAMVNPAYIATEKEAEASTLKVIQRKPVTPGERNMLLQRRNEEFSTKQRKTASEKTKEDTSVMNSDNEDREPPKQPKVMINGNTLNLVYTIRIHSEKI